MTGDDYGGYAKHQQCWASFKCPSDMFAYWRVVQIDIEAGFWIDYYNSIYSVTFKDRFKTSEWNEYVFGSMSHPTYVISVSLQAKRYVLIWFKYLIPLTTLKFRKLSIKWFNMSFKHQFENQNLRDPTTIIPLTTVFYFMAWKITIPENLKRAILKGQVIGRLYMTMK